MRLWVVAEGRGHQGLGQWFGRRVIVIREITDFLSLRWTAALVPGCQTTTGYE
jgi:hypothetical protein